MDVAFANTAAMGLPWLLVAGWAMAACIVGIVTEAFIKLLR